MATCPGSPAAEPDDVAEAEPDEPVDDDEDVAGCSPLPHAASARAASRTAGQSLAVRIVMVSPNGVVRGAGWWVRCHRSGLRRATARFGSRRCSLTVRFSRGAVEPLRP